VEPESVNTRLSRARQLGRTVGIAVFALIVATFTAVCSVQICLQVWAPEVTSSTIDCSAGTLSLVEAIEAARLASADQAEEQAALAKFRGALTPAWTHRAALDRACTGDVQAAQRLRAVDRLRYAEEHAVRYGAVDLARRRQEVKRIIPLLRKSEDRAL
jgi:hypothetical protein